MALWLVRAGKHGEYEKKFLKDKKIYLTWDYLKHDLAKVQKKSSLLSLLHRVYPDTEDRAILNWSHQIWPFAHDMHEGDWVVLPSKFNRTIHFAKIAGPYVYNAKAENPYYHSRNVEWFAVDIPRANFAQDLLYSFGAFLTVCQIKRNNAEERIQAQAKANWKMPKVGAQLQKNEDEQIGPQGLVDIARDQIAESILQKYKGHGLARLVDAILRAQGYTTVLSPEGPDQGADILAAPGPLGFGHPRMCVQVKSEDSPISDEILTNLIGSMKRFKADQGLLVSWSGFKRSIDERANFFEVRLWNQDTLISEMENNYDKLDDEIRAEIPLKRLWVIADIDEAAEEP